MSLYCAIMDKTGKVIERLTFANRAEVVDYARRHKANYAIIRDNRDNKQYR